MKKIRAVALDVFGTLVRIGEPRRPYRKVVEFARANGCLIPGDFARRVMSADISLVGAARMCGADIPVSLMKQLEADLETERNSIELFADAQPCLERLRGAAVRVGLCSNLASPYAAPVENLFPFALDERVWSFEVGAVKPDPAIYRILCERLGCAPHEVLMIGDTVEADYYGPRAFGMRALHLARDASSPVVDFIVSLNQLTMPILAGSEPLSTLPQGE